MEERDKRSMSNRSFLNLCSEDSSTSLELRYGNNIIPFIWWLLFSPAELEKSIAELQSDDSTVRLTTAKEMARERLHKIQVMCAGAENLSENWETFSTQLLNELQKSSMSHIQVDLSEICMLLDSKAMSDTLTDARVFLSDFKGLPPSMTEGYLNLVDLAGLISSDEKEAALINMEHSLIGARWE